jgi:hypothetical protein
MLCKITVFKIVKFCVPKTFRIIKEIIFVILHSEHELRLFEDRVVRRNLHYEELRDLYSSPSIIGMMKTRRMRFAGHVAGMGQKKNAYILLVAKPEGKRPLRRTSCSWVDNIKMDVREIRGGGVDCIGLAQDRDKWSLL